MTRPETQPSPEKFHIILARDKNIIKDRSRDLATNELDAKKRNHFLLSLLYYNRLPELAKQREISAQRKKIEGSDNIFADSEIDRAAHEAAIASTLNRFGSNFEDELILRANESRKSADGETRQKIVKLISWYLDGGPKHMFLRTAKELAADVFEGDESAFSNLVEVAEVMKTSGRHFSGLAEIDAALTITIGEAAMGIATEGYKTKTDRWIERACSTRIGRILSHETIAAGVATATSVGSQVLLGIGRSRIAAISTLGASAIVGGVVAGARNRMRFEQELKQHQRDLTQGKRTIDHNKGQRAEFEKKQVIFEMRDAQELIETFRSRLEAYTSSKGTSREAALIDLLDIVSDVSARKRFSDYGFYKDAKSGGIKINSAERQASGGHASKVELIGYSSVTNAPLEKDYIDYLRATAITTLRQEALRDTNLQSRIQQSGNSLDELLKRLRYEHTRGLVEDNERGSGIAQTVARIEKMKKRRAVWGGIKGAATGVVVGTAVQELIAFVRPGQVGLLEQTYSENFGKHQHIDTTGKTLTPFASFKELVSHSSPQPESLPIGDPASSNVNLNYSEGTGVSRTGSTFEIRQGNKIVTGIKINSDGTLDAISQEKLRLADIKIKSSIENITEGFKTKTTSTGDFLQDVKENGLSKYHAYKDAVKFIDRQYSTDQLLAKNGEKFEWKLEDGQYKMHFPLPSEAMRNGLHIEQVPGVLESMKVVITANKGASRIIEIPVTLNGDHFEATIPQNHPAYVLFEHDKNNVGQFKGASIELAQANGMVGKEAYTYEAYAREDHGQGLDKVTQLTNKAATVQKKVLTILPGETRTADTDTAYSLPYLRTKTLGRVGQRSTGSTTNFRPVKGPIVHRSPERSEEKVQRIAEITTGDFVNNLEQGIVNLQGFMGAIELATASTLLTRIQALSNNTNRTRPEENELIRKVKSLEGLLASAEGRRNVERAAKATKALGYANQTFFDSLSDRLKKVEEKITLNTSEEEQWGKLTGDLRAWITSEATTPGSIAQNADVIIELTEGANGIQQLLNALEARAGLELSHEDRKKVAEAGKLITPEAIEQIRQRKIDIENLLLPADEQKWKEFNKMLDKLDTDLARENLANNRSTQVALATSIITHFGQVEAFLAHYENVKSTIEKTTAEQQELPAEVVTATELIDHENILDIRARIKAVRARMSKADINSWIGLNIALVMWDKKEKRDELSTNTDTQQKLAADIIAHFGQVESLLDKYESAPKETEEDVGKRLDREWSTKWNQIMSPVKLTHDMGNGENRYTIYAQNAATLEANINLLLTRADVIKSKYTRVGIGNQVDRPTVMEIPNVGTILRVPLRKITVAEFDSLTPQAKPKTETAPRAKQGELTTETILTTEYADELNLRLAHIIRATNLNQIRIDTADLEAGKKLIADASSWGNQYEGTDPALSPADTQAMLKEARGAEQWLSKHEAAISNREPSKTNASPEQTVNQASEATNTFEEQREPLQQQWTKAGMKPKLVFPKKPGIDEKLMDLTPYAKTLGTNMETLIDAGKLEEFEEVQFNTGIPRIRYTEDEQGHRILHVPLNRPIVDITTHRNDLKELLLQIEVVKAKKQSPAKTPEQQANKAETEAEKSDRITNEIQGIWQEAQRQHAGLPELSLAHSPNRSLKEAEAATIANEDILKANTALLRDNPELATQFADIILAYDTEQRATNMEDLDSNGERFTLEVRFDHRLTKEELEQLVAQQKTVKKSKQQSSVSSPPPPPPPPIFKTAEIIAKEEAAKLQREREAAPEPTPTPPPPPNFRSLNELLNPNNAEVVDVPVAERTRQQSQTEPATPENTEISESSESVIQKYQQELNRALSEGWSGGGGTSEIKLSFGNNELKFLKDNEARIAAIVQTIADYRHRLGNIKEIRISPESRQQIQLRPSTMTIPVGMPLRELAIEFHRRLAQDTTFNDRKIEALTTLIGLREEGIIDQPTEQNITELLRDRNYSGVATELQRARQKAEAENKIGEYEDSIKAFSKLHPELDRLLK